MKKILVVEDETHLAIGIKYNLEAEGYDVTTVGDGPTALRYLETANGPAIEPPSSVPNEAAVTALPPNSAIDEQRPAPFDLVILDLMLPGMSGYTVCESLRAAGHELPVLMLSARTLAEDRVRGFDSGTDQYLMKPFDLDELLSRVKNLLARSGRRTPAPPPSPVRRFGDVRVDFDRFEVLVGDKPQRLTHMEMKLLRYFMENEGRLISRDELLERVWGFASSPTTRTVDNFISRLRKFFEIDPAQPRHFLSVRGAGYKFVAGGDEAATELPVSKPSTDSLRSRSSALRFKWPRGHSDV